MTFKLGISPSAVGLRLIKQFEGFSAQAYPDPLHGWALATIGYGTTVYKDGRKVSRGDTLTEAEADLELSHFVLKQIHPGLQKIPHVEVMNETMIGALESFAYNLGAGFYNGQNFNTISNKLRNHEWETLREALLLYVNPGSSVEAGLRNRRKAEAAIWEQGLAELQPVHSVALERPNGETQTGQFGPEKLLDFFLYFNKANANHLKAVQLLAKYIPPEALRHEAEWVSTYRSPLPQPQLEAKKDLILTVPYYSQRDSRTPHALRMCFSSSNAMLLSTLKPTLLQGSNGDDAYLARVLTFGDTTEVAAQLQALKSYGLEVRFRQNLQWEDLDKQLAKGIPVPIGILHQGPVTQPSGFGHWIIVIGKTADGSAYYVHDPYGDLNLVYGGYGSTNGRKLKYSKKNLGPRWISAESQGGWGILA